MKATIEISMYPLHDDYEKRVLGFLEKINQYQDIEVITNGLSTQVFGDYHLLMKILTDEMQDILEAQDAIFVIKIGKGILKYPK